MSGQSWFATNPLEWDTSLFHRPIESEFKNLNGPTTVSNRQTSSSVSLVAPHPAKIGVEPSSDLKVEEKSNLPERRVIRFPGSQIVENLKSANFAGVARGLANYVGTQTGLIQGIVNYDDSKHLLAAQNALKSVSPWKRVSPWSLVAEFCAVFTIVTFALVVGNDPTRFYLIGALCGVFLYLNGHISGGHSNPAITFACWLRGKMDGHSAALYVLAQTLGAIVGATITWVWYVHSSASTAHGHIPLLLEPHPRFQVSSVGFCELFYCTILCLLYLTLTSTRANQDNDHYEVVFGAYYSAAAAISTNMTRSYLNPAVALGIALSTTYSHGSAQWVWVYLCLDAAAALIAATWFRLINVGDLDHNSLPPKGRNQNIHMQGAFDNFA